MSSISTLAANPNAVFGLLVATELGRGVDSLAARAGVKAEDLGKLLDQARAGEMRRVPASDGENARRPKTSIPATSPSIPDRKPAPAATAPAREELPKMPEIIEAGPGDRPRLDWVDVDLIDVDETYQREADARSVDRIAAEFRWDHFGAVVLAPKIDGRFNCTDGQHRVLGVRKRGDIPQVPALITALSGTVAEASNFLTINRSRRAVSTIEIYWAGIASDDPASLRVRDAVAAAGCDVVRAQGAYRPGLTSAVGAISRSLQSYGDGPTVRALKVLRRAWPNDNKALRGTLITALARIYKANDVVNDERMVKVLEPRSFAELTAHAEAFRKLSGGSADTVLARTIAELFNKGLSANTIFFGESR